jgi:hypothetical protein
MTMVSADKYQPSGMTGSSCLEIVLLKRTFILPWHQFLYAEGGNDEIRLAFATHEVVMRGTQLGKFLTELSARRVNVLREPGRAEEFRSGAEPRITSISVEKME